MPLPIAVAPLVTSLAGAYLTTPFARGLLNDAMYYAGKLKPAVDGFSAKRQSDAAFASNRNLNTTPAPSVSNPTPQRKSDWHDAGNINPSSQQAAQTDDFVDPATITPSTPTPYQQITGTAPTPKPAASRPKAAPKKQVQSAQATTTTPPKSVGNPDWHDAGNSMPAQNYVNAMPVQRSAGMSPDTSYDEAAAISNAVQAEMDAANQAAFDNKYNQLLAMYGIAPGSGAPKVNQDAAMQYYGDQAVYDALARAYAGAPVFNAWG